VDFERVPDLVEKRRVFIRGGKAFLPLSEQQSLIIAEFSSDLEAALEVPTWAAANLFTECQRTAKTLPRLDEDDRLVPILNHLSLGFTSPEYTSSSAAAAMVNASNIDQVQSAC
jgi:DNA primase large subunit